MTLSLPDDFDSRAFERAHGEGTACPCDAFDSNGHVPCDQCKGTALYEAEECGWCDAGWVYCECNAHGSRNKIAPATPPRLKRAGKNAITAKPSVTVYETPERRVLADQA